MRKTMCWAALAGLLGSGQALAVTTDGHEIPYFGGAYLHEFADSARDSDDGNGFSLTLGTPFHMLGDDNALELTFSSLQRSRDIDGDDDYQSGVSLDLVHDFGLFGWGEEGVGKYLPQFKPFVLGGVVAVQDDVRGDKNWSPGVDLGAGLLFPLPWYGAAARAEWRVQGEANDTTVAGEDYLIDYRINVGVQVPLTPLFREGKKDVAPAKECDLAVVDPQTGRSDCGADSDRDGVIDGADQCPGTPEGTPVDAKGCPMGGGSDNDHDGVPDMVDACPGTKTGITVDMNGCAVGQTMSLRNVYFNEDTAELTTDSRMVLDEVVTTLKGQPNLNVEIGGHADSTGSAAYNLMLSQQRAEAVRQYLIAHGIDGSRLTAQGYGEFRPAGKEAAENRRVEFKLIVE